MPPTGWTDWEGPLKPRAFDLAEIAPGAASPWQAGKVVSNAHVEVRFWRTAKAMDRLVRNGDGDELMFVHEGAADLFCDFGHLAIRDGDYVMIPRGTMWRIEPQIGTDGRDFQALLIEATNDSFRLPDRGMLGAHALFDPAMLDTPAIDDKFRAQWGETEWKVVVKRRHEFSTITYPFNPLDAIGWKGNLAPVKLNWRDIRPVMSHRYHIPPSVHSTFVSDRFVVCTFAPRMLDTDPDAIKVPYAHSNVQSDEVLYYVRGHFGSRRGVEEASFTLHPRGIPHGPHPGTIVASRDVRSTDELAVMVDTFRPLQLTRQAIKLDDPSYPMSWID